MEEKKMDRIPNQREQAELSEEKLDQISGGGKAPLDPGSRYVRPPQTQQEEPSVIQRRPGY